MKRFLILIITNLLVFHSFSQLATIDNVYNYIKENQKSPEEYIISKFKDYDLVFLGEHHRIKHDVNFVASLIPTLYKNGITNLGYEFYEHTIQHSIDSLLSADLGLTESEIINNLEDFVVRNRLNIKEGSNTFQGNINGIQKSIIINVNEGQIRSLNMYPGYSNRPTRNPVINFGKLKW